MIKPVTLSLRILALIAVAGVRVVAAVVELIAELFGILAFEILMPALDALQTAQTKLTEHSETKEEERI